MTITAAGATDETTQEIGYKSCDTIEIRVPKTQPKWRTWLRSGWDFFVDRIAPPLIGCVLGTSMALAFWLLFLLWWLG